MIPSGETRAPTLELDGVTWPSPGGLASAELRLCTQSGRVGLIGDWDALILALTGELELTRGSARLNGVEVTRALRTGEVGLAMSDADLPSTFSVRESLQQAARLTHGSASRAAKETERTLERFALKELAGRPLAQLALFQRRALAIACATVTGPGLVVLQTPLRGLDVPSAEYIARLCHEVAREARIIVTVAAPESPSPERSLLDGCEELFVLERGGLVAAGPPERVFGATRRYALRVSGAKLDAYWGALRDAGYRVQPGLPLGSYGVELPPGASTDLLLDAAIEHDVVLLELQPLYSHSR